jgi:acetyl-CoA carboxylase carboxyltransferase component
MDMYKVIARLVDGSKFDEFKSMYGTSLITGLFFPSSPSLFASPTF